MRAWIAEHEAMMPTQIFTLDTFYSDFIEESKERMSKIEVSRTLRRWVKSSGYEVDDVRTSSSRGFRLKKI
jgi:hypothetical protein